MMPQRRRAAPADLQARCTRRRTLGRLHNQAISTKTLNKYAQHCCWFLCWLQQVGRGDLATELLLDNAVQEYIEFLWDMNLGLSVAQATVCGVQHMLNHTVKLRGAWRITGTWRRCEPPTRAPPLPQVAVLAMAMQALSEQDPDLCVSLLIAFFAFLRTGEVLALTIGQVFVDNHGGIVISLGQSKSGKRRGENEFAIIDPSPVATIIAMFLASRTAGQSMVNRTELQWRQDFDRLLATLHIDNMEFRPYSLRRGGATQAFVSGMSMSKIMVRGRWRQDQTARIYIQEGTALLQHLALQPAVLLRLQRLAAEWGFSY